MDGPIGLNKNLCGVIAVLVQWFLSEIPIPMVTILLLFLVGLVSLHIPQLNNLNSFEKLIAYWNRPVIKIGYLQR